MDYACCGTVSCTLWSGLLTRPPSPTEGLLFLPITEEETFGRAGGTVGRPCHNMGVLRARSEMSDAMPTQSGGHGTHSSIHTRARGYFFMFAKAAAAALAISSGGTSRTLVAIDQLW